MNPSPLVSVIMPCRNGASTISAAVSSVLSQTYPNLELLIIDDGSADDTVRQVEQLADLDKRVRLFRNPEPGRGVSYTRNIGLQNLRGDLASFLDCDDIWFPWSVEVRLQHLIKTGADITYGSYMRLYPDGRAKLVRAKNRIGYRDMLKANYIGNLTGMYDLRALGVQPQEPIAHEDYHMWLKLIKRARLAGCNPTVPLGFYRVCGSSLSGRKASAFVWHWNVLRKNRDLSFWGSVYCQTWYTLKSIASRI